MEGSFERTVMANFKRLIMKYMTFDLVWEEWSTKHFKSIGDDANYNKQRKLSDDRLDEVRNRIKAQLDAHRNTPPT
jgi:hypothetical protein